jgi:cell division protein FtsW
MDFYEAVQKYRKSLLIFLAVITCFGLVMVLSSSYQFSKAMKGSSYYFFNRQLMFFCIASVLLFVVKKVKSDVWYKYSNVLHFAVVFLIFLTIVPGVSHTKNGASRWLQLFGFSFQPAEFLKYSLIPYGLRFFDEFDMREPKENLKQFGWIIAPIVMLVLQPDFGSLAICSVLLGYIAFISSFSRKYFYAMSVAGVFTLGALAASQPYRLKRLMVFLDPWKDPTNSGFQITQSLMSFAHGSFFGQGLGNSLGKLHYLPEAHNDFIFSIIGEETGFMGILILVLLFVGLVYSGLRLADHIGKPFQSKIVSAITFCIGIQAILNMGVVLALLPTKGLNLPFISYGGSSLIANFFAVGMLLSLSRPVDARKEVYV